MFLPIRHYRTQYYAVPREDVLKRLKEWLLKEVSKVSSSNYTLTHSKQRHMWNKNECSYPGATVVSFAENLKQLNMYNKTSLVQSHWDSEASSN
uniref:Uncharacterized protein n=1 Tax=Rhipicephalus zambeziensis TaxID=60191 RepID=A0A224YWE4_9ACAR